MTAEIITIGDEILIGQIVDTNSVYIAKALNAVGISVHQISSVQDDRAHILEALAFAKARVDLVLVTGGLGPTKDDITKHTFCEYFADELILNQEVLDHVRHIFKKYIERPILPANESQAYVPSKATVLMNRFGTAPGMWMEKEGTIFVSMPGVPYEMKGLMEHEVIPKLTARFKLPYITHSTLLTYGLGESAIAHRIADIEENLPDLVKLAYLPSLGRVRIRLSSKGSDKKAIDTAIAKTCQALEARLEDIFVGYEEQGSLEQRIGHLLEQEHLTLAIAESCTGGQLVQQFTQHPGASHYLKGSLVTYATQSKVDVLGVPQSIIKEHSVVSAAVAQTMAQRVRDLYQADIGIATTGNAGPSKGDADAEVGTVFIGIASAAGVSAHHFKMGNHRHRVIGKTVNKALELLQEEISKISTK